LAIVMHRVQPASHHVQTLPQLTSLLVPADELIKRGGAATSGLGPSCRSRAWSNGVKRAAWCT